MSRTDAAIRAAAVDWKAVTEELDRQGWSVIKCLLDPRECGTVSGLYAEKEGFRSRVVMARHGFGRGEYRYFGYPLPDLVGSLRNLLYPPLADVENRWYERMGSDVRFPHDHRELLDRCHAAGQTRPTPLLLRYGPGDYNCLHQDIYGETVFPLEVAVLLSAPWEDFDGGEFVITEQRPRMQIRAAVIPLSKGDAVVFAVKTRPVRGMRGDYRVALRHGVSEVWSGLRHALEIISHDAA